MSNMLHFLEHPALPHQFLSEYTHFTLLHETEAGTACDHITLNFERQDGRSLQIVVQKEVLDCISSY